MAKNRPVRIWIVKHTPSKDPKFHHDEMLDGVGRSINDSFIILISGWFFRTFVIKCFCS